MSTNTIVCDSSGGKCEQCGKKAKSLISTVGGPKICWNCVKKNILRDIPRKRKPEAK